MCVRVSVYVTEKSREINYERDKKPGYKLYRSSFQLVNTIIYIYINNYVQSSYYEHNVMILRTQVVNLIKKNNFNL